MTKEETQKANELLLNVLKDGLLYGLQLKITDADGFTFNGELRVLFKNNGCRLNISDPVKRARVKNKTIPLHYSYIKPYLRPMSSMTEEEKEELFEAIDKDMNLLEETLDKEPIFTYRNHRYMCNPIHYELDFLNSHHFDYHGLIPKGLALEASEEMYKIK